ncbi:hypothetical protein EDF18_0946 [Frigoribacterium sp. PhB107]|uniref:hypothetical protein n=1 Tax=Frigoribacterium sp. PhB107 TaxID=2485172 RepID=UPI000F4A30D5|nr:hypothetical protein [Frigoribacterium sp. PhB107]ROP78300.1 hypothetical protein EDF18_0946 [Frigoribacterium sp. PhB107]
MAELAPAAAAIAVANEVLTERDRQDAKWGEQNHPDGTGKYVQPFIFPHSGSRFTGNDFALLVARIFTGETDAAATGGQVTWRHILAEEVFEAIAEADPVKLRAELIQVAAVAQQWVQAIDRRGAAS